MKLNISFILIIFSLFIVHCNEKKKQVVPLQLQQQILGNSAGTNSAATSTIGSAAVTINGEYETQTAATTIINVSVDATVVDETDKPIKDALVEVKDSKGARIFLQVSNANGLVQGSLSVNAIETSIVVHVSFGGISASPATLLIKRGTNEVLVKISKIKVGISSSTITTSLSQTTIVDSDKDGVPDSLDAYPNDATKTAKVRFPTEGVNTLAFEDTFPSAGDADLNDMVLVYFIEEDHNAEGQIVEIRGNYQIMASGAGNKLSVYQRFPSTINITYQSNVYDGAGVLQASAAVLKDKTQATSISQYTPTATDLQDGLRVLGNTTTTMTSWNARNTQPTYVNGFMAKTKIVFTTPVARSVIGLAPYDTFIRIENGTRLDTDSAYTAAGGGLPGCKAATTAGGFNTHEIHRTGYCKKADGSDVYKDSNNFPFAVIVPGLWKWPLEAKDIRNNSMTGYPRFANWMATNGAADADWYNEPNASTSSFVYYSFVTGNKTALDAPSSQLLSYIGKASSPEYQIGLIVLLLAISLYMIYRWRKQTAIA